LRQAEPAFRRCPTPQIFRAALPIHQSKNNPAFRLQSATCARKPPFAQNPVIIETERADDFSPVKNAEGVDSPRTCRDDQLRQFARRAQAAGIDQWWPAPR
jgi:hypothetical protein